MNVHRGVRLVSLSRRFKQLNLLQTSCHHTQVSSQNSKDDILARLPNEFATSLNLSLDSKRSNQFSLLLEHEKDLLLTASIWAQTLNYVKPKVEISDPSRKAPMGRECNDETSVVPEPGTMILPKIEPNPKVIIEKKAHRLLKIKKRKMKVHRRKRRWKKYWAIWRKKYAFRERRREVEFRQRMKAKVHEAQKFDPEKFVNDYLEDMKYELVPKTYKGKRLPRFMIKQLLEEDEHKAERKRLNELNMLTGKPLVMEKETVQDFIKRTWNKQE